MKRHRWFLCLLMLCAAPLLAEPPAVRSAVLAKATHSWDGSPLPAYPRGTPEITVVRIEIPPHTKLPLHQHPMINVGLMLSGTLTVTTDANATLHLKTGDPIIEVVNKWHYGENTGDIPAVIVVVYAGEQGAPLSIHPR